MNNLVLIFFLIFTATVSAQEEESDTTFQVKIETNIINPVISIDSAEFSPLNSDGYQLQSGEVFIEAKSDEPGERWDKMRAEGLFNITSDTLLILNSPVLYTFISEPFNAGVYHNDSLLGLTPLRYLTQNFLDGIFTVRKDGYFTITDSFEPGKTLYRYELSSITGKDPGKVIVNRRIGFETPRKWWLISGLGAATIAGAYSSFNFKSKANDFYDEYLITRNEETLDKSNRYDVYFTVALVAMQAALGALIYFLFFD